MRTSEDQPSLGCGGVEEQPWLQIAMKVLQTQGERRRLFKKKKRFGQNEIVLSQIILKKQKYYSYNLFVPYF